MTRGVPSEVFFARARATWESILAEHGATVAHPEGQPDEIAGYTVHWREDTMPAVAWLYVAYPWRRLGVGRALLREAGVTPGVRTLAVFGESRALRLLRGLGYQVTLAPFLHWRFS